jgi:transposase-like protein
MLKTYSVDLREKAMQFYKESQYKSKTCELFNIAKTTLDDWILIEPQTG